MLIPELIQQDATVEALTAEVHKALQQQAREQLQADFEQLHQQIRRNSGDCAAAAIANLLGQKRQYLKSHEALEATRGD